MKTFATCKEARTQAQTLLDEFAAQGYRITLESDGCAQIRKPDGAAYHVHNFSCDCPDALNRNGGSYQLPDGRNVCKHTLVIGMVRPCESCSGTMLLQGDHFECIRPGCSNTLNAGIAKMKRQEAREIEEVLDALHDNTPNNPDEDPEMVPAWTACDTVVDQGRGTMTGFWAAIGRGEIRKMEWGGTEYVFLEDIEERFPAQEKSKVA